MIRVKQDGTCWTMILNGRKFGTNAEGYGLWSNAKMLLDPAEYRATDEYSARWLVREAIEKALAAYQPH